MPPSDSGLELTSDNASDGFDPILRAVARAENRKQPGLPVLARGQRMGHYEIVDIIGEGGMGAVYEARDLRLGRTVALKLVAEVESATAKRWERLQREARALAAVDHPNLATVYSLELEDGLAFITMERVAGESLRERLRRGPLSVDMTLRTIEQLLAGLMVVHKLGIVHRDIKPGNVVMSAAGVPKLVDFGLAKFLHEDESGVTAISEDPALASASASAEITSWRTGVVGTPAYMAPEQQRGEAVDARADVWAIGLVMVEAMTGSRSWDPATRAKVPRWLRPVIDECLSDERSRRLPDAAALAQRLARRRRERVWRRRLLLAGGSLAVGLGAWAAGPVESEPVEPSPNVESELGSAPAPATEALELRVGKQRRLTGIPANHEVHAINFADDGFDVAISTGELLRLDPRGETIVARELGPAARRVVSVARVSGELLVLGFDVERGTSEVWRRSPDPGGGWEPLREGAESLLAGPGPGRFAWTRKAADGSATTIVLDELGPGPARTLDCSQAGASLAKPVGFSPTGDHLAVYRRWPGRGRTSLDLYELASGRVVASLPGEFNANTRVVWTAADELYYLRNDDGAQESNNLWLARFDAQRQVLLGAPQQITQRTGQKATHLVAGAEPGQLAFIEWIDRDEVVIGPLQPDPRLERCLSTTFGERVSDWGPNGELLLMFDRLGDLDAMLGDCEAQRFEPLLEGEGWQTWPTSLADGRILAWSQIGEGSPVELLAVEAEVRDQPRVVLRRDSESFEGIRALPPPKSAALRCARAAETCVLALLDGDEFRLHTWWPDLEPEPLDIVVEADMKGQWDLAPDGRRVAIPHVGEALEIVELETGRAEQTNARSCYYARWDPRGDAVFALCFAGADMTEFELRRIALEAEDVGEVWWRSKGGLPWEMAISPDAERIALSINRLNTDVRLLDIERHTR